MSQAPVAASDRRFETLFDQAPFSVQLLSLDGRTVRVNQAWKELWAIDEGSPVLDWIMAEYDMLADPQLEAKGVTPYLRRAFAGEAVQIPAIYYDPAELGLEGRARWVEATASPVRGEGGRVTEVMLIHQDVTDQLMAQNELRASELRLKQLANTIPQLAWIADSHGNIEWYNERWFEYTGTTAEKMKGWGWQSVHDPTVLPVVLEKWRSSIASGEPFEMTFPLRGRDGNYRSFLTLVEPLRDHTGKVVSWFGTNTDVTSLQEAEEVRREEARRKDEFLAMLGHELRNPLAPITNAVHLLKAVSRDEQVVRAARIIERQARHMTKLVDDLLDVSRVTRGLIRLQVETLRIGDVIEAAVEQLRPTFEARDQNLDVIAEQSVLVRGDRVRLVQVLANLLNNAAKYSSPGSRIEIGAVAEGPFARISVRDQGEGIDPNFLPHVFTLFAQAHSAIDRPNAGLGIGLSLVKRLVEMHGGEVAASSSGLGLGSCFSFTIPRAAAVEAADSRSASP